MPHHAECTTDDNEQVIIGSAFAHEHVAVLQFKQFRQRRQRAALRVVQFGREARSSQRFKARVCHRVLSAR